MRVAISGMFWDQPYTGSGQYLRGLLEGLRRVAPEHEYLVLAPAADEGRRTKDEEQRTKNKEHRAKNEGVTLQRSNAPTLQRSNAPTLVEVRTPFDGRDARLAKLWFEQVGVPLAARRLGADVLHVPYAAPPLLSRVPVVATVHDIIWWLLPEYRGGAPVRAYFRVVAAAIKRAARILADSEHSRRDIIAHLGCAPERVATVLLAAREEFRPLDRAAAQGYVAERYGLRGPFVYYVGSLEARKNIPMLLRAFARLRRSGGPPATLVLASRPPGDDPRLFPDIESLIDTLDLRGSVRRIDASREDNPQLYAAAELLAYPSRYEGFGLQPLEAMACGTPVLVSDASSLPEVVGPAALRAAPDDVPGWTAALWRLLADPDLRADLRRRGLERAALFSYDRAARETIAVYEELRIKN